MNITQKHAGRTGKHRQITVITKPMTADGPRHRLKSGRARSPLRPGVYVGGESDEHAKLQKLKIPRGLPDRAKIKAREHRIAQKRAELKKYLATLNPELEDSREAAAAGGMTMWQKMVEKLEDQSKSDETKAYQAWRKKVIECARSMQLEVARFKLDE